MFSMSSIQRFHPPDVLHLMLRLWKDSKYYVMITLVSLFGCRTFSHGWTVSCEVTKLLMTKKLIVFGFCRSAQNVKKMMKSTIVCLM